MTPDSDHPRGRARELGRRRYYGKPCKHHGRVERYVANADCVECTRLKNAAYRKARSTRRRNGKSTRPRGALSPS